MKKRFLVVPLVVGVAGASWAGTTLYGGSEARQAYDAMLADVGAASGLTLVPRSYEAGFLQSEAITELRVGGGENAPALLRFRHTIEHSPVGNAGLRAARILTTVDTDELDEDIAAELAALFDGASPLTIDSVIGLGGDATHEVIVAAWAHDAEAGHVASGAMQWSVDRTREGDLSGTGSWPGLTFASMSGEGVEVSWGASHDRFDYAKVDDGLYVGDYMAELGDLAVTSAIGMSGSLTGMRLSSSSELVGDAYRGEGAFDVASMDLPVALDSLRASVRVEGLAVDGLSEATRAATALDVATFSGDEAALQAAVTNYVRALSGMLRPGLAVGYGLELANAGGRAMAGVDVGWKGGDSDDGLAGMNTVGDVARAMRASATLNVDGDALALTPVGMLLDPSSLAPWIVSDAEGYRADIRVENLVMEVNGMPMPLEAMLGEVLDASLEAMFDGLSI